MVIYRNVRDSMSRADQRDVLCAGLIAITLTYRLKIKPVVVGLDANLDQLYKNKI